MAAHKSIAENDTDIRMALLCRLYENTRLIFKTLGLTFQPADGVDGLVAIGVEKLVSGL